MSFLWVACVAGLTILGADPPTPSDIAQLVVQGRVQEAVARVDAASEPDKLLLAVADELVRKLDARGEQANDELATVFGTLLEVGLTGQATGRAQGELLLWAETLWDRLTPLMERGPRLDAMAGRAMAGLSSMPLAIRTDWLSRIVARSDLPRGDKVGPKAAAACVHGGLAPSPGPCLAAVADAWLGDNAHDNARNNAHDNARDNAHDGPQIERSRLTEIMENLLRSPLALDRLLAVMILGRTPGDDAERALKGARGAIQHRMQAARAQQLFAQGFGGVI